MRILSQDNGKYDLPYENIVLEKMTDCNTIYAYTGTGQPFKMAVYSSVEKMDKAMEMLHEAYCGAVYMKHADYEIEDIDLSQELEKKIREEMLKPHFLDVKIKNPVIECKVFRFPTDDEVEV